MTDVTDKLDVISRLELQEALYNLATEKWGSTHAQAEDFSKLHWDQFGLVHGVPTHLKTNLPADHAEVQSEFSKSHPHLLPPVFVVSDADKAFVNGDMTARARLTKEIGLAAATALAERYGLPNLHSRKQGTRPENLADPEADKKKQKASDRANNPFSREGWNISKQGALLKAIGVEKTAQIAASVGARIGQTKPSPNF